MVPSVAAIMPAMSWAGFWLRRDRPQSSITTTIPGAIPISATLRSNSDMSSASSSSISYRFVSDFPFGDRAPHALDDFEENTLTALRSNSKQKLTNVSSSLSGDCRRLVAPVVMGAAFVACLRHPQSPERDGRSASPRHQGSRSVSLCERLFSFDTC